MAFQIPSKLIEKTAFQIYLKRSKHGIAGTPDTDWQQAKSLLTKETWRVKLWNFWHYPIIAWIKKLLHRSFKWLVFFLFRLPIKLLLPVIKKGKKAFVYFWSVLPNSSWAKLLGVPLTLSIVGTAATNQFQEESRQNEIVTNYFKEMEKIIIDEKIDLSKPENKPVLNLIQGRTQAVLADVDNDKKASLIQFMIGSDFQITFNHLNFSRINLSGFNLRESQLQFTNLRYANLSGTDLSGANLQDADLTGANLNGANLQYANLENANLTGADLRHAALGRSSFYQANLSNANLSGAFLYQADFQQTNLSGANLHFASLSETDFRGANLKKTKLSKALYKNKAEFGGADLSQTK